MSFRQYIQVALRALYANKARSFLTMLGMVIGVGSVIVAVSLVEGARDSVTKEFEAVGSNLIFAFHSPEQRGTGARPGVFEGLTMEDARAIEQECDLLAAVCPNMQFRGPARAGREERATRIMGTGEGANDVLNVEIAHGRSIAPRTWRTWPRCASSGRSWRRHSSRTAARWAGGGVRGVRLQVIGCWRPRAARWAKPRRLRLRAAHHRSQAPLRREILSDITAGRSPLKTEEAADRIWATLRRRHPNNVRDFVVDTQQSVLASIGRILNLFAFVLGASAGWRCSSAASAS